jgi:signal transduction histidine kinase
MRFRPLWLVAGVALAALTLAVATQRGDATTYAGASPIAAAACAAMIIALASAAATSRKPWGAAGATLAVTLPVWAGTATSPALRTLADAFVPIAFPFLLSLSAGARRRLVATATAVTAVLVGVRLLVYDPLLDLRCFANCLPNPFVVVRAPGLAHVVEVASGPVLTVLALAAVRGRPRDAVGPGLLAAGIALHAATLVADPVELATRSELQLAYCLAVAGAATIGAVAAAGAVGAFLARRAVLRLARDLRSDSTRADLQAALRRTTHDPALRVLTGEQHTSGSVMAVRVGGQEVARIAHAAGAARALERALGPSARLALANAALRERLEQRVERLRQVRERILTLGDSARRAFERDLHDGAQQGVLAVLYELRLQAGRAAGTPLAGILDAAADDAAAALDELRELARGIHPAILLEAGLRPALRSLASGTTIELTATPAGRYPAVTEATVYRVVDEAVQNAATHAEPARIVVAVVERGGALVTTVQDDGVGGAKPADGGGLAELSDRVGMCGGSLTVRSDAGHGTVVEAIVPCA